MVVVHGITELGLEDPRLWQVGAAFRRAGFLVLIPSLPGLVSLRDVAGEVERVTALLRGLSAGQVRGADAGRVGVFGISVGGGLALRSVLADRAAGGRGVQALCLLGAPEDGARVARAWFEVPPPRYGEEGGLRRTADAALFARSTLLRAAAPRLLSPPDLPVVEAWLARTWRVTRVPEGLATDAGHRFARLALGAAPEGEAVEEVLAANDASLRTVSATGLSPGDLAPLRGVAVFLVHGASDPLVPLAEVGRLAERLRPHAEVRTLESRLVGHVEVGTTDAWAHVLWIDDLFDEIR
jgi:acetyl esterase/lipase